MTDKETTSKTSTDTDTKIIDQKKSTDKPNSDTDTTKIDNEKILTPSEKESKTKVSNTDSEITINKEAASPKEETGSTTENKPINKDKTSSTTNSDTTTSEKTAFDIKEKNTEIETTTDEEKVVAHTISSNNKDAAQQTKSGAEKTSIEGKTSSTAAETTKSQQTSEQKPVTPQEVMLAKRQEAAQQNSKNTMHTPFSLAKEQHQLLIKQKQAKEGKKEHSGNTKQDNSNSTAHTLPTHITLSDGSNPATSLKEITGSLKAMVDHIRIALDRSAAGNKEIHLVLSEARLKGAEIRIKQSAGSIHIEILSVTKEQMHLLQSNQLALHQQLESALQKQNFYLVFAHASDREDNQKQSGDEQQQDEQDQPIFSWDENE